MGSRTRPADILVTNWDNSISAAFDVTVASPLNSCTITEAGMYSGAAVRAAELRKHTQNDSKCAELSWKCIPLAVECYGAWGPEALKAFSQVATRLAIRGNTSKSMALTNLFGRLSHSLIRANARAILSRSYSHLMQQLRKEGLLFLQCGLLIKKWKRYNFVLNQANFQYFKLHEVNKTKGQIIVSDILRTEELLNFDMQRTSFSFAVYFSGHGSPWILDAPTEEERKGWIEALQFMIQWPTNKTPCLSRVKSQIEWSEYVEMGKQFDSESEYEIMQPAEKLSSFDPAVIQLCQLKSVPYTPVPEYANLNSTTQVGQQLVNVQGSISPLDIERDAMVVPSATLSEYVQIGQGQFGEVFKATMFKGTPAEVTVTVKTVKGTSSGMERDSFIKEMCAMSKIMHPNIVQLFGLVYGENETPSVVFEYLSYGDLKSFLSKNHRSVQQLVKYMIDVAMGMHYIAERRLTHRNLALKNVYVGENEICKIADCGLFRELPNSDFEAKNDALLSFRWMAPECVNGSQQLSIASDVWSYGILMWEMFNPDLIPYHNILDTMECMSKICEGYRLRIPEKAPNILSRLMKASWHESPEKRPNFSLITTLLMTKGLEEAKCGTANN
ncbi:hypothetical protein EMCRGX_G020585 [Ephydatia muelleri]